MQLKRKTIKRKKNEKRAEFLPKRYKIAMALAGHHKMVTAMSRSFNNNIMIIPLFTILFGRTL